MASLDIDLEPIAELHLQVGKLSNSIDELRKNLWKIQDDLSFANTAFCPNPTTTFAIDLGCPSAGKWWQVRNVTIGGVNVGTAAAGQPWLVVASSYPDGPISMGAVRWATPTGTTLPWSETWGQHELVVLDTQHLYAVVTGGTAGQQYAANAMVESFNQFVRGQV